jgi:hypothetical protein
MAVGCTVYSAHPTILLKKHFTAEETGFYFVNCACGVVNNTMLFSVTLW